MQGTETAPNTPNPPVGLAAQGHSGLKCRGGVSLSHHPALTVSPCSLCPAVMGALESRGVLRRMSDMLELLMKRMDILARLENSTDFHKGDEARFPLDRSVGCAPGTAAGLQFTGTGELQKQKAPQCVLRCQNSWAELLAQLPRARGMERSASVVFGKVFGGISEVPMNFGVTLCPLVVWQRGGASLHRCAVAELEVGWSRTWCKGAVLPLPSTPRASSAALRSRSPCKHISIVLAAAAGAPQGMGCLQLRLQIAAQVMPGTMGRIWEIPASPGAAVSCRG